MYKYIYRFICKNAYGWTSLSLKHKELGKVSCFLIWSFRQIKLIKADEGNCNIIFS